MKRDERAVLVEKRQLSPDAFLFAFEAAPLAVAAPGQFTMVRTAEPGLLLRRPYSFCTADPAGGRFTLLVKVVGAGTRALAELSLGSFVDCLGPLGTAFHPPAPGREAILVAGGVGIAPFVGFSRLLAERAIPAHVLLGGRREHDLYLRQEFERLGMNVHCTTEDGSFGERGVVTDLLSKLLAGGERPVELFSCGPSAMLVRVAAMARERKLPHQVSIERRMGCGMGCCLGCVVFTRGAEEARGEYRRSCTEGPVFDAEEICWERDPRPM
jgi:dihydroorotate dehydrogenase electron transfer subunit